MRHTVLAAACVSIVVAALSAQNAPPPQPSGSGVIAGRVVDAASNQGVADVAVTALLSKDVPPDGTFGGRHAILTDAEGRFVLRGLPAGRYQVSARRAGYLENRFGSDSPGGEGRPIVLTDDGRYVDAEIRIWKPATIAGTIRDEAGDPIIGLEVRALKRTLTAGRWRFGEYYSNIKYDARTDDRGAYRISDLTPGEYIVVVPLTSAVAPASLVAELETLRADPASRAEYTAASQSLTGSGVPMFGPGTGRAVVIGSHIQTLSHPGLASVVTANGGPLLVYQTQFYPGVGESTLAQTIVVNSGEERTGLDFSMRPVRTAAVSGMVTGPAGPMPGLVLRLFQTDGAHVLAETEVATTVSDAKGAFTFLGVPAGQYVARVWHIPRPAPTRTIVGSTTRIEQSGVSMEPTLWADVPVSVGDVDVTNVQVSLGPGVRATGRVVFAGTAPTAAQRNAISIVFDLADGRRYPRVGDERVSLMGDTFVSPELLPGKYLVRTTGTRALTLQSVVVGDRDTTEVPLVVSDREIPPITITLNDGPGASLSGTVRAGLSPTADAVVFLFPVDRALWLDYGYRPARLRHAVVAGAGDYSIESIPPGEYFVVALADNREPDWRAPEFLDAFARVASRVTIGEGEAKTLDLSVERLPQSRSSSHAPDRSYPIPRSAVPAHQAPRRTSGPFVDESDEQAPVRDASRAVAEPTGNSILAGMVVSDDANRRPVRRVVVTITSADPRVGRTAVTDASGRFEFMGLPAGAYTVSASKPGFLPSRYGASKPGRAGTAVAISDDQRSDITVRLQQGSVITGVVRDERGQLMRGVSALASRYEFVNGQRQLVVKGRSHEPTDDRGAYRIFNLEPGEYFVSVDRLNVGVYRSIGQTTAEDLAAIAGAPAGQPAVFRSPPPEMGYAAVFHPGTPRMSQASLVVVGPGQERAGVDIAVSLVALARVSASVVGPDGLPPAMVQAQLLNSTPVPGFGDIALSAGMVVPVSDGRVVISGVPPGEYTLDVGGSSEPPPPMRGSSGAFVRSASTGLGLPMFALVPLIVEGIDIGNLNVVLERGRTVSGRVVFDGAIPQPALSGVRVFLDGAQVGGLRLDRSAPEVTPEFTIGAVVPAAYRVSVAGARGWMVRSAMINGQDASDLPVEITSDVSEAVITLTDRLTEVSGVLQTENGTPASSYFIIVFPRERSYWLSRSRRIVSLRPDTSGRFTTTTNNPLPPGDYLMSAVGDVAPGEWFDPAFLETLVSAALPLTLGDGEKKRQDIRIR
jgi:hypothetical protein